METAVLNRKLALVCEDPTCSGALADLLSALVAHAVDTELVKREYRAQRGEGRATEAQRREWSSEMDALREQSLDRCEREMAESGSRVMGEMEAFKDRVSRAAVAQTREELDVLRAGWIAELQAEVAQSKAELSSAQLAARRDLREAVEQCPAPVRADTPATLLLKEHLSVVESLHRTEMRKIYEEMALIHEEVREIQRAVAKRRCGASNGGASGGAAAASKTPSPVMSSASAQQQQQSFSTPNTAPLAKSEPFTPEVKERGIHGVTFDTCKDGLVVLSVDPGSEAAQRGLKSGCIVSHVGATLLSIPQDLLDYIDNTSESSVKLTTFDPETGRVRFLTLTV